MKRFAPPKRGACPPMLRPTGDHKPVADVAVNHAVGTGRGDAAALVMAAHDDVADVQIVQTVLNDSRDIDVVVGDDVGNVAVDEQFTGPQPGSAGGTRVGAADPEHLGVGRPDGVRRMRIQRMLLRPEARLRCNRSSRNMFAIGVPVARLRSLTLAACQLSARKKIYLLSLPSAIGYPYLRNLR